MQLVELANAKCVQWRNMKEYGGVGLWIFSVYNIFILDEKKQGLV